jgi:2-phospho-L-lactate guanylyltransferase
MVAAPRPPTSRPPFGVVVPVRAFGRGGTRLAPHLTPDERAHLARRLAERVVAAAGRAPVVVVSDDPEVVAWAADRGLRSAPDPGSLDAAARAGAGVLAQWGCVRTVVAHADLPDVTTFAAVTRDAGGPVAVLVPCHRADGTPVLSLPTEVAVDFGFAYGPDSFRRHTAVARAAGLAVRVVRDPHLAFDVDTPDDVAALLGREPGLLTGADPVPAP